MTNSEELVEEMLAAWQNPFATDHDPRHLLALGAQEIQRLRKIIEDYAAICEASSREITHLREFVGEAAGVPPDGESGGEATPDSPDGERAS